VGGAADIRVREREFSARGQASVAELMAGLEQVVDEAAAVLDRLPEARLAERTRIQEYDVTVLEAIYHVVEHFSQHTGQIIFLTKLLTGANPAFYRHLERGGAHGERTP